MSDDLTESLSEFASYIAPPIADKQPEPLIRNTMKVWLTKSEDVKGRAGAELQL